MTLQNGVEVATELMGLLKDDTQKIKTYDSNNPYSLSCDEGKELIQTDATFEQMGLKDELVTALHKLKFEKPTEIQANSIPIINRGHSAAFQSKSGTGKTIAFAIGALQAIQKGKGPQVIILSPTRELSIQIGGVIKNIADHMGINICFAVRNFVGGNIKEEIIVGSPVKLAMLAGNSDFPHSNIKMIILDEADELINVQAFSAPTLRLLKIFYFAQKIFFSATFSENSQKALKVLAPDCNTDFKENVKADKIQLYYLQTTRNEKLEALKSILALLTVAQVIIFVNHKHVADKINNVLTEEGSSVTIIHGGLTPEQRDEANLKFLKAESKVLVSTNVFSRGMDIPQVNLIINYDIPDFKDNGNLETYIHRIGRSGRFNRSGFVIDFITSQEDLDQMMGLHASMNAVSKMFNIHNLNEAFSKDS